MNLVRELIRLEDVHRAFGAVKVLDGVNLRIDEGDRIGVVGHNGAGKSTLLRIMAGEDRDFEGMAQAADGVRVGYVSQEPQLDPECDVRGNIEKAVAATCGPVP